MALDFSSLEHALGKLGTILVHHERFLREDPEIADDLRTASIQAFEYGFELSVKFLRRVLADFESDPVVKQLDYRDLMRHAAQYELISHPKRWFDYRDKRNITSHTYDEAKAVEVFSVIPAFLEDAHSLLERMKSHAAPR